MSRRRESGGCGRPDLQVAGRRTRVTPPMSIGRSLLLLVALGASGALAGPKPAPGVVVLTDDNFEELSLQGYWFMDL